MGFRILGGYGAADRLRGDFLRGSLVRSAEEEIVTRWYLGLLAAGVAACAEGESDAPGLKELHLTVDGSCTVTTPADPGFTLVTLHNNGGQAHRATLVRLDESTTDSALVSWYASRNTRLPTGAVWTGGPGATPPGGSSTVTIPLSGGRYVALCLPVPPDSGALALEYASFLIDTLAASTDQEPPLTDAILQVGTDSVRWIPTPAPGSRMVRIVNQGMDILTVSLIRIDDTGSPEQLGEITELGAGREGWIAVAFRPGRYDVIVTRGTGSAPGVTTRFVVE